jgi:cell division protein ZapA
MTEKSPNPEHKVEMDRPATSKDAARAASATSRGAETRSALHEVAIAGVPLRLKSTHDEATVSELVALVDRKVKEALPLTKTGSIQNAAILAALHLAEEFLTLKRMAQVELEKLEAKTLKVISEMESSRSGLMNGARAGKPGEEKQGQGSTATYDSSSENSVEGTAH